MDHTGPLSFEQEWLWLLDSATPGLTAYNVPRALRVRGPLDLPALERALTEVVERQAALRTTFRTGSRGEPVQVVAPSAPVPVAVEDLSGVPEAEHADALRARLREIARRKLDLARDPLLAATLLKLGPDQHVLSLLTHHIVSDGGSREILFRELAECYSALCRGERPKLPALPIQYLDFARAQRERLQGGALDEVVAHWRTRLAGAPAALELPTDRPRPAELTFSGAQHSIEVPAALAADLAATAQGLGVTLHMLMLAAFQALLYRYTGQDDLVVGCPMSGRDERTDNLVGFFATVLPFRVSIAGDPTFAQLVERVAEVCYEVYEHPEMPLEPLMRALQQDGRPPQAPLFQAMMVLEHEEGTVPVFGKASVEVLPHEHEAVATDLTLVVRTNPAGIRLAIQYRTDLWDGSTAERMLGHFVTLLTAAVRTTETRVAALPLADAAERALVLDAWNNTGRPYPKGHPIHGLVAEQAARTPDATAVVCGEVRLSYRELEARATSLAHRLQALEVGRGSLVGVAAERAADTVVSFLGVLKAGAAYVPLDPAYPADRLQFVARDAGLRVVVGRAEALAALAEVEGVTVLPPCRSEELPPDAGSLPEVTGGDLIYAIYTSGSTGTPKGVLVTHDNIVASTWARVNYYPEPVGCFLLLSSFAFDSSVAGLYWTLVQGGKLVIPAEGTELDAPVLCELLGSEGVTHLLALPSLYQVLLEEATDEELGTLRAAMVAAEPCPQSILLRHRARAPQAAFYNEYGLTETSVWCTVFGIEPDDPLRPVTIGGAIPNARLYVLDSHGQPAPIGVPGELCVGGAVVAQGYLNRDELTLERFVPDRFAGAPGARMYHTGDRVRWLPNGELEFLGRIDNQVKVRGYRIELEELEAALRQQPVVRDAAAITREDTPGDVRLVAYLTLREGDRPTSVREEIRSALRQRLPGYMVPSEIVVLDALPQTPNGKVDRQRLPRPSVESGATTYLAPEGALEETIAAVMADVLGLTRVGAADDFFVLGGTSLAAMRLMARLSRALDARLTWSMLFETPTVRPLAARVRKLLAASEAGSVDERIPTLPEGTVAPLSFAQELLWLLDRASPGLNAYNVPLAYRVTGTIDQRALERALGQLIARHEPLRTVFVAEGPEGTPRQVIQPPRDIPVERVDLRSVDRAAREDVLAGRIRDAIRTPFDLTRDLLLRATLFELAPAEQCVLLVTHHIGFDEFSSQVLMRELAALYDGARDGRGIALPPLPVRFAEYAAWQRESLERGALVRQLEYWRERLREVPALELPTSQPRPATPRFEGARRRYLFPAALLEQLRGLASAHDATLFMTLLASFKAILHRYSGQQDIVVGAPITSRSREELEPLIGYFPNVLVLRTALDGDPTFAELVSRVRATCLGAYTHQDVPLEKLVLELRESGRSGHDPLFQVLFLVESRAAETQPVSGAALEPMAVDFGTAKFDVMLAMGETPDGLRMMIEYRTDLFDTETIDRMAGHLRTLLESVAANPDQPISAIPLLSPEERRRLLVEWNDTVLPVPADATMHGLVEAQAARTPHRTAVVGHGVALSYAELDARASAVADRLRGLGVGAGAIVAVCLPRTPEMVVALLGVLKSGAAYVALDPAYPPERIAFMLEDTGAPVVLTTQALALTLPETRGIHVVELDRGEAGWPTPPAPVPPAPGATPADLGYIIYTSGSTGKPKGVAIEHRNAVAFLEWARTVFTTEELAGVLASTSLCFDLSIFEVFAPLVTGGAVVVVENVLELSGLRSPHPVTLVNTVPSGMAEVLRAGGIPSTVRTVNLAGEPLSTALVRELYALGHVDRVYDLYGPSETTTYSTFTLRSAAAPATIGRPIANTTVYVLDQHGEPVPIGAAGELSIGGAGVARGYLHRPELTAQRFVPDPFAGTPNARMYRTGDKVRWKADGQLEFLGRVDQQVKVRGYRIELGEIEHALSSHEAVREAAVVVHEDAGDRRLVAYVVPAEVSGNGKAADEVVRRWGAVFDETYRSGNGDAESGFNIAGWVSSYDLQPIPPSEMREWIEQAVERILALRPRRVLDVGCGTGLFTFRIAPHCERYHGMDISTEALHAIQADPAMQGLSNVTLEPGSAHEIDRFAPGSFDLVVLNSVIQYFPSVEYLLDVVRKAARLVAPGGAIFLGDVRSLPLLETFHTSVALAQAAPTLGLADLRKRIQQRLGNETELVVDPAFFEAVRVHLPAISETVASPKRGRARNELTKFRYDVTLRVGGAEAAPGTARAEGLEEVRKLLLDQPTALRVMNLRDRRLARDLAARELLATAAPGATVGDLLEALGSTPEEGIEPEELLALDPEYAVELLLPQSGLPGRFDALFRAKSIARAAAAPAPALFSLRPWRDYVHHASPEVFPAEQVREWREYLGQHLPEYMVPQVFVRLQRLPLTPNGKLDRKALKPPSGTRSSRGFVEPRNAIERTIARFWAEVLRVDRVGVEDGFLELGGHSLLAMRILGLIRQELGVSLSLAEILGDVTVAGLAAAVEEQKIQGEVTEPALEPVDRGKYTLKASA